MGVSLLSLIESSISYCHLFFSVSYHSGFSFHHLNTNLIIFQFKDIVFFNKILTPSFISVALFFVIFIMPMHLLYLYEYFLMAF